ncbi:MAG: hypothetical protein J0L92_01400 [Deltaproteobacteria bacterium]|nr:hypothetical protein [Deltaproteobacteria bacterium]
MWLHSRDLSPIASVSVGSVSSMRHLVDVPSSIHLDVSSDGRWARVGMTLIELDTGTTHDLGAIFDVGDACDVPSSIGAFLASAGTAFRPDARRIVYGCQQIDGRTRTSSRAWELDLESFVARPIDGDCSVARYTPASELLVRDHACPGDLDLEVGSRLELDDGTTLPLPPGSRPFSRHHSLRVSPDAPHILRWIGPSEERVLIEDLDEGVILRMGREGALILTPSRRIEVSIEGALRVTPLGCSDHEIHRADDLRIVHCARDRRTSIVSPDIDTDRGIPGLDDVTPIVMHSFERDSEWALVRRITGAFPIDTYLVDTESLEVEALPTEDADLGALRDIAFRHPALT